MGGVSQEMDRWGLVFSGGGGKGAYEIGAWKAINESGINIQAVSGASVGALNGALFACGSLSLAEAIWREKVSQNVILKPRSIEESTTEIVEKRIQLSDNRTGYRFMSNPILPKKALPEILIKIISRYYIEGYFSKSGLENIILQSEIYKKIRTANISCYVACFDVSRMKEEYFRINEYDEKSIVEILLASSAIPIVYSPETINYEDEYVDGGIPFIGDNVPIYPLCEIEGCNKILVINLEPQNILMSSILTVDALKLKYESSILTASAASAAISGFTLPFGANPIISYLFIKRVKEEIKKKSIYKGVKIYRLYPSKSLGSFVGTLNFGHKDIEKKINMGYMDTKKYLQKNRLVKYAP